MGNVLRIVPAAALLAVLAAGCGGGARLQQAALHGVPPGLAQDWEGQASAIASAASAGNSCRALQLAASLRSDVAASEHKLPFRLRSPLLTGVNALADRITCTPTPKKPPKGPKPEPPPKRPGPHGHDRGHDN
jgi:hypothetical protein